MVRGAPAPGRVKKLTAAPVPKISGTAKVGKVLEAKPGTWKPSGVRFAYQWYRGTTAIDGATRSSYVLTAKDRGKRITVQVTGSKAGYASVARKSKATKKVALGTLTTAKPKIAGTAKVGKTLTAKAGTWKPAGLTLTYQWYRSGRKIGGATQAGYVPTTKDKGRKLTVKVTGRAPGYATRTATSTATRKIR